MNEWDWKELTASIGLYTAFYIVQHKGEVCLSESAWGFLTEALTNNPIFNIFLTETFDRKSWSQTLPSTHCVSGQFTWENLYHGAVT